MSMSCGARPATARRQSWRACSSGGPLLPCLPCMPGVACGTAAMCHPSALNGQSDLPRRLMCVGYGLRTLEVRFDMEQTMMLEERDPDGFGYLPS